MPNPLDKEKRPKLSFSFLLLGFLYVVIRIVAECLIQYRYVGLRAFNSLQGYPFFIVAINVTTACMVIISIISIVQALAIKSSSIRGLKISSLYFIVLVAFFMSFYHRVVMYSMCAILILLFAYISFSPYIKRKYPRSERKNSFINNAALFVFIAFAFSCVYCGIDYYRKVFASLPLKPDTVIVSRNQYSDGFSRFDIPMDWSLDSLYCDTNQFPVSLFHDGNGSNICVYSGFGNKGQAGHNRRIIELCPTDRMGKQHLIFGDRYRISGQDVYYSQYAVLDSLYWSIATVFDNKSRKNTSFTMVSNDSERYSSQTIRGIVETLDFRIEGELFEE